MPYRLRKFTGNETTQQRMGTGRVHNEQNVSGWPIICETELIENNKHARTQIYVQNRNWRQRITKDGRFGGGNT